MDSTARVMEDVSDHVLQSIESVVNNIWPERCKLLD